MACNPIAVLNQVTAKYRDYIQGSESALTRQDLADVTRFVLSAPSGN